MSDTQSPPKKETKRKAPPSNAQLPFLVEFAITAARLTVLFAGVLTISLALLARADPWTAAFRGGSAFIVTGLFAWMAVTLVGNGALEAAKVEIEKDAGEAPPESTMEKEA